MKHHKPPKLHTLCAVSALLVGAFPNLTQAATTNNVLADTFYANYPANCTGGDPTTTGLCLLGSTAPLATGSFIARQILGGGHDVEYPITLNLRKALPVGNYLLYQDGSTIDSRHETPFTVTQGQIYTLKTAAIKFQDTAGKYNKLQHFQARDGVGGEGCNAEVGSKGIKAYLPGSYIVSIVPTLVNTTPKCEHGGVAFNVMAGQGVTLRPATVSDQTLPTANRYHHSGNAISLTNLDPLRHDVREVAYLPNFKRYQGIQNPSSAKLDGLVFSAAPNHTFIIPVKTSNTPTDCGVSVAAGGIPQHSLITDCVFDGSGNLTRFRVNAGSFYALDNTHNKSTVAAHTINSPFMVGGVKFNLKGN